MKDVILLALRCVVALILVQTLYFKFSGHPESVYIFSTVGMEPYGRIGIGIMELIAAILILIPSTIWLGAGLSLGLLGGAIFMHLTILGIIVQEDKGILFTTAVITFLLSLIVLWFYRKDIPIIGNKL